MVASILSFINETNSSSIVSVIKWFKISKPNALNLVHGCFIKVIFFLVLELAIGTDARIIIFFVDLQ